MPNIDILNHILVPKFEIMKDEELKLFFKERGISRTELPTMKAIDPVVPLINAKSGDVVKITRKSNFGGICYYYRVVE